MVNLIIYYEFNSYITKNLLTTYSKLSFQSINQEYPGEWRSENNILYKGDKTINNNYDLVDIIKKNTGAECTIFLSGSRVTTTIMKDGNRAIGTNADARVIQTVINEGSEYLGSANVINTPFKTMYIPIKDNNNSVIGMFFVGIEKSIIDKQVNGEIFLIAILTLILLTIVSLLMFIMSSRMIISPIKYIDNHLEAMATGDLTIELQQRYLRKKDEFGQIANSINTMQEFIKGMIKSIYNSSHQIDGHSENLVAISEEMSAVTQNVSTAIRDVSRATEDQTNDLVEVSTVINKFGAELENIVEAIKEVELKSVGINSLAIESNSSMESLMTSVGKVGISFKEFASKITRLGQNITEINGITNLINSIADQTNLLALNAAIEAARAGESGRGFSVVAEEIRKLAEQSKESSGNIKKLIESISSDTKMIVDSTEMLNKELDGQISEITTSIESFRKINNAINEVIPRITAVNESASSIRSEKDLIYTRVDNASSVAQEVCASSEEVTASTEGMSQSSRQVADTSEKLYGMIKYMLTHVDKFKI